MTTARVTEQGGKALRARFRSLMVIGEGGMGRVEVALEKGEGGFERVVALKRMRPELAKDSRNIEMFLREARLAALLSHPNVVSTFAFGDEAGELYLAMEYVEGETLAAILEQARQGGKPLDPELALRILEGACEGLHAAHELKDTKGQPLNLVHRDVTPHNIMVSYDGRVKLLDFGVAKIEAAAGLTRTGEVKGKMAYMAPEQAMGEPTGRRSDLYSIGAILYEALAGKRMWGDGTDLEIMRRMAFEEAPTLSTAPASIVALQEKLVRRSPDERPKTAREVASILRAASGADDEAMAAMMTELFGEVAVKKRASLLEAMESSDLSESTRDAVRESLPVVPRLPGDGVTAPVVPPAKAGSRTLVWVGIAAVVAVGIGLGSTALRATPSPSPAASSAPDAAVREVASAANTPIVDTDPPKATTTAAARPVPAPVRTAKPASSALAPASSSSAPVDVDPNPI